MQVLFTTTADTLEPGDHIEYVTGKGKSRTMAVTEVDDQGSIIAVTGLPDDIPGGEKVTVSFQPDDFIDILGA